MKRIARAPMVLYLLVAAIMFAMNAPEAAAKGGGLWVSPAGDDSAPGTRERPWRTLARAAKAAGPGDIVLLMSGTWAERLIPTRSGTANAPVVFAAAAGATPVIEGKGIVLNDGFKGLVHMEGLAWIEVRGLALRNSGPGELAAGVMARKCEHITVRNCRTAGTNSSGIGIWFSKMVLVEGNDVTDACRDGSQECITVAGCEGFEIARNTVHDCVNGKSGGEGIDAKHSAHGTIHGNTVHHTRRLGIYVDAWDFHMVDVEVYDNLVYETQSNGYALAAEDNGTLEGVRFHDNVAFRNAHVGLTLADWGEKVPHHGLKDIIIERNNFIENGKEWGGGIRVDNAEAEGIVIRDNLVANNGSGQIIVDKKPKSIVIEGNFITAPAGREKGETIGESATVGVPRYRTARDGGVELEPGSPGEGFGVRAGRAAESGQALRASVVISGTVISRSEVWDRRTNPLMGRPDILKEIVLEVGVSRILSGVLSPGTGKVGVSIKGRASLIEFRHLAEGWKGTFHLAGEAMPYELAGFTDGVAPAAKSRTDTTPKPVTVVKARVFPDDYGGREVRSSRSLQERAVREISRRYGMKDAGAVFLVSHRGPVPPPGGYVYWGVKGRIGGKWHIWQAGGYGKPRPGTELEDPKRYQK